LSIASKTGARSLGELEMTLSTSNVAVCCFLASFNSQVRCATFVSRPAADDARRHTASDASRRFFFVVVRRRFFHGIAAFCARADSGDLAAAAPSVDMNCRLSTSNII
jgi:hypothetical protein